MNLAEEQLALSPPSGLMQTQSHGPEPVTGEALPTAHKLVGAKPMTLPLPAPQTPLALGDGIGVEASTVGVGHNCGVLLSPRLTIPGAIAPLITLALTMTIITLPASISRYSSEVWPRDKMTHQKVNSSITSGILNKPQH